MRLVHISVATPIRVLVAVCAPLFFAAAAQGATVNIRDQIVIFTSQSATQAQGRIEFNLRFNSFSGSPVSYSTFSAQMAINQQVVQGVPAIFTLDTTATGNTSSIGPDYWLTNSDTDPLASPQGGELRFRDIVSALNPVTPSTNNVLAHFVIDFDVGSSGFGTYQISMGNPDSNFFFRLFTSTPNMIASGPNEDTFVLAPEPTSGLLVLLGSTTLLRRRRRRCGV